MSDDPYLAREAEKYSDPIPSREFILSHLTQRGTPADREMLSQALGLTTEVQQEALRRRLRAMERDGQLIFTRRQCYALPERLDMVRGHVIGHRDGYGFLRVEGTAAGARDDLFLSVQQMRQAMHGDLILAQPMGVDRRGRREARVVRVLEPRQGPIVGRYLLEAGLGFVLPDDQRLNFMIAIAPDDKIQVRAGQVVVVTLLQRPAARSRAVGTVVEVLGDNLAPGIEIEIAIRNYGIPYSWPEEVQAQVAGLTEQISAADRHGRVDLRHLPLVTIDGEDSRDFDDAVYAERRQDGWQLWVAIADVGHYVPANTPLDEEARRRGNSVYFPQQVVAMLPEVLSSGLCSLNPLVDRLCLVCDMTISAHGTLVAFKFYEAVMHSRARLTYTQVANLLQEDSTLVDVALRQKYAPLLPSLQILHQLFHDLKSAREQRGGIEFETQETQFIFNEQRRIDRIVPLVRNDAHKIIEECMILANIAAAQWVQKHQTPILYRVHDVPNEERLTTFRSFLKELGLSLGGGSKPPPTAYAVLMAKISSRPDSELIQSMLLRSMQPAIYTPENRGHFGLALAAYAHFTSPIRRYPDLTLHRTLKAILARHARTAETPLQATSQEANLSNPSVEQLVHWGEHCSMTERRADEATREVSDWLKCEFMQDHVGAVFRGVIAGVASIGFFVRLDKLFIDGLVHVSSLDNDYYHFDAVGQRLIGDTSGNVYRLGDAVQVKVMAVHLDQRKLDFALVSSERRTGRPASMASVVKGTGQKMVATSNRLQQKMGQSKEKEQVVLLLPTKAKKKQRRSRRTRGKIAIIGEAGNKNLDKTIGAGTRPIAAKTASVDQKNAAKKSRNEGTSE